MNARGERVTRQLRVASPPLQVRHAGPSSTTLPILASIAGVADCATILGYVLDGDPAVFAAAAIVLKLVLLPFMQFRKQAVQGLSFVAIVGTMAFVSQLASPYQNDEALPQIGAFSVSLLLSVWVVADETRLVRYGKAFVDTVCASALLYLAFVLMGQIPVFSRAMYFSGSHPNLGSEINAVAAVAACIFFRSKGLALRIAILTFPVLLMQGRAALATIILALAITFLNDGIALIRRHPAFAFIGVLLAFVSSVAIAFGYLDEIVRVLFLTDDAYRGQGTGLVGRTDRWQIGWDLFLERPLVGNGWGVYDVLSLDRPHSFFFYGLANLGLMFLILLALMAYHGVRMWQRNRRAALIMSSLIVMMMLNDRFLNLNPYPFVFFVLLLGFSMLPGGLRQHARPNTAAHEPNTI